MSCILSDELIETVGILRKPKVVDITEKSQTATTLVECCIFCSNLEKVCVHVLMLLICLLYSLCYSISILIAV